MIDTIPRRQPSKSSNDDSFKVALDDASETTAGQSAIESFVGFQGAPRPMDEVFDDIHKWIRDVDRITTEALSAPHLKEAALHTISQLEAELTAAGGEIISGLEEAKARLV